MPNFLRKINDRERKILYKLYLQSGITSEQYKKLLSRYNIKYSTELTLLHYVDLKARLKSISRGEQSV